MITPTDLEVLKTSEPEVGMLLRFDQAEAGALLRITHIFERSIYVMAYDGPSGCRVARRPIEMSLRLVKAALDGHECSLCRVGLPSDFSRPEDPATKNGGSKEEPTPSADDVAYEWIEPLIVAFDREENLRRHRFTATLKARASELQMCFRTLLRTLLRFYYFGRVKQGLVSLVRGPRSDVHFLSDANPSCRGRRRMIRARCKRRGRQPVIRKKLKRNNLFVVDDQDAADMFAAATRCAREGPTNLKAAHKNYLETEFARRHRWIYRAYIRKRHPEPVTYRQFRLNVQEQRCTDRALIENLPAISSDRTLRSGHASGPGEIYEIDATGGRVFLVDENDPDVVLGTPTIYLLIDRWSRFIVSIYVTLGFPSWDEVRYALLVAFTSRVRRFRTLGIEIDEAKRWPVGRMCAALAQDRASELLSNDYSKACARELRIDPLTLPPLCPDGKAVIERTIRDLKKRMAQSGLRGVYAKRPLDPKSKRQAKRASRASVASLRDLYRVLVKIVDEKNNAPHTALKKNLVLAQAGVPPIPTQAYLWGCANITGARVAPLTDADCKRMLLGHGTGTLREGQITFEKFKYEPADIAAIRASARSTNSKKPVAVRFDRTFREEISTVSPRGEWALWRLTRSELKRVRGITMDEEARLVEKATLNTAVAANDSQIEELTSKATRSRRPAKAQRTVCAAETRARRRSATRDLKSDLLGRKKEVGKPLPHPSPSHDQPTWRSLEAQERQRTIDAMRRSDQK